MMRNNLLLVIFGLFLVSGCNFRPLPPPIEDNVSYPVAIKPYSSTSFLMLNSTANETYIDGSIQYYQLDALGNPLLASVISIPTHGSDIAVTSDRQLLALSFDGALDETPIWFFNYSNPHQPVQLDLSVTLNPTGAIQAVKNLSFFEPIADPSSYYLHGTIFSFPQDNGDFSNIPDRVFVLKVNKDLSSVEVLFYLSYGMNDPSSLLPKSDSLNPFVTGIQYAFGSQAPTFDTTRQWLMAFPTGTMGGFNDGWNTFPGLPDPLSYFGGRGNQPSGNNFQFDFRSVSMMVVNFSELLSGTPLNQATYFSPLGWNQNGLPYGALTNGDIVSYPNNGSNSNLNSFEFQTGFWASQTLGFAHLGDQQRTCYAPSPTTAVNQFDLNGVGSNGMLLVKRGTNGTEDYSDDGSTGFGNEVFFLTGLDLLQSNIDFVAANRPAVKDAESDFKGLAPYQTIDPYNSFVTSISTNWPTNSLTNVPNPGPVTPYMYSRTTGNGLFDSTFGTAIPAFGVLNFGADATDPAQNNQCLPYWIRDTYQGLSFFGLDSAWLGASTADIAAGASGTYANAVVDPTQLSNFSFPWTEGAQMCTDLSLQINNPVIYCVNFLTGVFSKFSTQNDTKVFYQ